jgi:hypothetical protein
MNLSCLIGPGRLVLGHLGLGPGSPFGILYLKHSCNSLTIRCASPSGSKYYPPRLSSLSSRGSSPSHALVCPRLLPALPPSRTSSSPDPAATDLTQPTPPTLDTVTRGRSAQFRHSSMAWSEELRCSPNTAWDKDVLAPPKLMLSCCSSGCRYCPVPPPLEEVVDASGGRDQEEWMPWRPPHIGGVRTCVSLRTSGWSLCVESMSRDWGKLWDDFCFSFYPCPT